MILDEKCPLLAGAFPLTLWGFPKPSNNVSKFGLDLDGIICHSTKKKV